MKVRLQALSFGLVAVLCAASSAQAGTIEYQNEILSDNPLVYYQFDETSGATATNSGSNGNDGTITGTVTQNQTTFLNGGTSYDFGNGHVGAAGLTSSLTEWTVEAWVNWDSAKTSSSAIFGNDQGGWNDDVLLGIAPEGTGFSPSSQLAIIQQGNPGTTRDLVSVALSHSIWHHVVATGSTTNGELKLYFDGTLVGTDSTLTNGVTLNGLDGILTAHTTVGASRTDGFRPFNGLIDEFAIYGTALSLSTIRSHHTAGITPAAVVPEPSGLIPLMLGMFGLFFLRQRRNRG